MIKKIVAYFSQSATIYIIEYLNIKLFWHYFLSYCYCKEKSVDKTIPTFFYICTLCRKDYVNLVNL